MPLHHSARTHLSGTFLAIDGEIRVNPFSGSSVRVDVGDVVYIEHEKKFAGSGDLTDVKCIHRGQVVLLPSDFLESSCERVAFEGSLSNFCRTLLYWLWN